jgi:hypothetical protein
VSCCCGKLVTEARGPFRNPEEGERPPLETATKQRLVKTVTDGEDLVCPVVICEACSNEMYKESNKSDYQSRL